MTDARTALDALATWLRSQYRDARVVAVGHRVVHGGSRYTGPVVVTPAVLEDLRTLVPLAPLHQPYNLAAIEAVFERMPAVPQVACFDTSFHRGQPPVASLVPLPRDIAAGGVQRYGFHGLSYEYIASVLPKVAPEVAAGRVIVAHLGSGASLCALRSGKSIDSTLGFTALDGLCMGTRPGTVDPGVILYLFQGLKLTAKEVETILYKKSGLLGISGISNDMRDLLDQHRAVRAARGRLLRLPRRPGDWRAGRRPRRRRRARLHRGNRRELTRDPQPHLPFVVVARHRHRPGRQHEQRPATLASVEPRLGVGDSDQRRADDRAPHVRAARIGRSARLTALSQKARTEARKRETKD